MQKGILELENNHFWIPNELIDLENDRIYWPMAVKTIKQNVDGNFFNGWIRLNAPELTNNLNITKSGICRHYVPAGVLQ